MQDLTRPTTWAEALSNYMGSASRVDTADDLLDYVDFGHEMCSELLEAVMFDREGNPRHQSDYDSYRLDRLGPVVERFRRIPRYPRNLEYKVQQCRLRADWVFRAVRRIAPLESLLPPNRLQELEA